MYIRDPQAVDPRGFCIDVAGDTGDLQDAATALENIKRMNYEH